MANYIPSPRDWVREQVELYESSGGTEGTADQRCRQDHRGGEATFEPLDCENLHEFG
jgi:hypothetical protein